MNGKSDSSDLGGVSTVTQEWQVANVQKGWVILLASHDACFCMLMTCWVAIKVLELINVQGPFAIKLVMTWSKCLTIHHCDRMWAFSKVEDTSFNHSVTVS